MKKVFKRLDRQEKVDITGYLLGEYNEELENSCEKAVQKNSVVFEDKNEIVMHAPDLSNLPVVKEEVIPDKKTEKVKKKTKPKAAKAIKKSKPKSIISKKEAESLLEDVSHDKNFLLNC